MVAKMLWAFPFALVVFFVAVNCEKLSKRMITEDDLPTNDDTTRVKKVIYILFIRYLLNLYICTCFIWVALIVYMATLKRLDRAREIIY
jgi:hypothetical protein